MLYEVITILIGGIFRREAPMLGMLIIGFVLGGACAVTLMEIWLSLRQSIPLRRSSGKV